MNYDEYETEQSKWVHDTANAAQDAAYEAACDDDDLFGPTWFAIDDDDEDFDADFEDDEP